MKELSIKDREQICKSCPILNPQKQICNPKLWINPDTNEVSTYPKSGYIRGCGCMVFKKMRNLNAHCVAGKW